MNQLWDDKRKEIGDAAVKALSKVKPKKDWQIGIKEFKSELRKSFNLTNLYINDNS